MPALTHATIVLLAILVACGDSESNSDRQPIPTDFAPYSDVMPIDSAIRDAGVPDDMSALLPDALPPIGCSEDDDCQNGWCDVGFCVPTEPIPPLPIDGVTRVGVATFDLIPDYSERWEDRAGDACPNNRAGRFDGHLDLPAPPDPCLDRFDDANENGRFDAIWLGGGNGDRPADGVDNQNPPTGRVLLLARDETIRILLTLDVYGVDAARIRALQNRLSTRLGLPPSQFVIIATGNTRGPDLVGLSGPSFAVAGGPEAFFARVGGSLGLLDSIPYATSVDDEVWEALVLRAATATQRAYATAVPARAKSTVLALPMSPGVMFDGPTELPDSDNDGVLNDNQDLASYRGRPQRLSRNHALPDLRDAQLRAIAFESADRNRPIAVLLGWGASPGAPTNRPVALSAGYPGQVRATVESSLPGTTAIWLTSASADSVIAGVGAFVPKSDADGHFLDAQGQPTDDIAQAAQAEYPDEALGRWLGLQAVDALNRVALEPPELTVTSRYVWLPLRNPRFGLAAHLGLLTPLGDWLTGRRRSTAWASVDATPACGGLGCTRHRLERLQIGKLTLLTTPGALDDAYILGRSESSLHFGDRRDLLDLDGDSILDAQDPELRVLEQAHDREISVPIQAVANPQQFEAIKGLGSENIWIVGRADGGIGSMRPARSTPNVFEGSLDVLADFVQVPDNAAIDVCAEGYPCQGSLTLGELLQGALERQPILLANITSTHEAWISNTKFEGITNVGEWRIERDGMLIAEGRHVTLGPGNRIYLPEVNLDTLEVEPGDMLLVGPMEQTFTIGGLPALRISTHPNARLLRHASSGDSGDLVYNAACELLFGGRCPSRREIVGDDPNRLLPSTPEQ